ncbi:MAG: type II-B CRISPR-associated RNA-guided endonuclease Cas9/Csx12 [Thiohalorhabdus sp.]|uniref:type II-B CRISPR-associated RNA-guided endonuclease Cas9/Csx12 n=1 Tax=Thiohalorhabdus sp. TaxID=3094134 RepID=UPI00397EE650
MDRISPVAVDLGARYSGVFMADFSPGEDPASGAREGRVLHVNPDNYELMQRNRRQMRHMRRNHKRRKLAKRLARLILEQHYGLDLLADIGGNQRLGDFINGLLNRRGYTYGVDDETDSETQSRLGRSSRTLVHDLFPELAAPESGVEYPTLERVLADLSEDPEQVRELAEDERLSYPKKASQLFKKIPEDLSSRYEAEKEEQAAIYQAFRQAVQGLDKAQIEGHHPRKSYLENIRRDIAEKGRLNPHLEAAGLTPAQLWHLLGHISNLQLRPLRWYFDDPRMKEGVYWDEARLARVFRRWLKGWRPARDSQEAKNRRELLRATGERVLEVWLSHHPEKTIPPYENQNNRRPPECMSLLCDPARLDEALPLWETIAAKLERARPELAESLHEKGPRERNARLLQRALDRTRESDPYLLFSLAHAEGSLSNPQQEARDTLARHIGRQHVEGLLELARRYYDESRQAREGYWPESRPVNLLRRCGKHPPHKANQLGVLLGQILRMPSTDPDSVAAAMEEKLDSRSTVRSVAARAAEMQKEKGNGLKAIYEQSAPRPKKKRSTDEKKVVTLFEQSQRAAEIIGEHLGHNPEAVRRYSNPFSLAQLHNLLSGDLHGFSKTCKTCTADNAGRNLSPEEGEGDAALALRLPADSNRPFDGVVDRALTLQARILARAKAEQIRAAGSAEEEIFVPVLIEQNRFEMTAGKDALKGRRPTGETRSTATKNDRVKEASAGVCPYTGDPLGEGGEIDHIVPQSGTQKFQGTVFQSEANLIYCSARGNQAKGDQLYTLDDLHSDYLSAQFGTDDRRVVAENIRETLQPFLLETRSFTSLHDLESGAQRALRHGLFLPDLRDGLLRLLASYHKARVNGTQGWFVRRFERALREELPGRAITVRPYRVLADDIRAQRQILGMVRPEVAKPEEGPQPLASHAIDALMALVAGLEQPRVSLDLHLPPPPDHERGAWMERWLPKQIAVDRMGARPISRKAPVSGKPLLKSNHFGERFLPVILDAEGRLGFGFSRGNAAFVQGDGAPWFNLLRPFLTFAGDTVEGDFPRWATEAGSHPRGYLYFPVDREKAVKALTMVNQQLGRGEEPSADDQNRARGLEALRYTIRKQPVSTFVKDSRRPQFRTREALEKDITKKSQIKVEPQTFSGLPRDLARPEKTEVVLPFRADWLAVLDDPELASALGGEAKEFNWKGFHERRFPRSRPNRQHQGVRKVFSLPLRDDPSGGVRLHRKHPEGQDIAQLAETETGPGKGQFAGFWVDPKGKWNARPLDEIQLSTGATLSQASPRPAEVSHEILLHEWRTLLPRSSLGDSRVREVLAAPTDSSPRFRIQLTTDWPLLKEILSQMNVSLESPFALPPALEFRGRGKDLQAALGAKTDACLAKLRTDTTPSLAVVGLGDTVTVEYTIAGDSRLKSWYLQGDPV